MHTKISELLQYAQTLRFYEDKLAHAKGDRFNIFDLLGVGSLEVSTHTPYLAEFLNPKGAHGLGDLPLSAFLRLFELNALNPAKTLVETERYLGPRTQDRGGRIDILLTDTSTGAQVAIENKLFAADQENQLRRYQASLPQAQLVYLTLNGREPTGFATGKETTCEGRVIRRLSYAEDIIRWQEDCRSQAAATPLVRETITQYINLIRQLTNQSTNTNMSTQIAEIVLRDKASLIAYFELKQAESAIHSKITDTLRKQCDEIAASLGLKVKFENEPLSRKEASIHFFDASMQAQHISIAFQFETSQCRDFFFGICYDHPSESHLAPIGILDAFDRVIGDGKSTAWWAAWRYWETRRNWGVETFCDIVFGRFKEELKDKLVALLEVVRVAQSPQKGLDV